MADAGHRRPHRFAIIRFAIAERTHNMTRIEHANDASLADFLAG